ncbi:MAG: hypothetical protein ACHQFZ_05490 [Acidimicrobiales bacterium]
MGELSAVVLGALLVGSFAALGLYAVLGVAATVSTLRQAARDRRLADEVDEVILAVLGPRSPQTIAGPVAERSVPRHPAG